MSYTIPSIPVSVMLIKTLIPVQAGQLQVSDHYFIASSTPPGFVWNPTGLTDAQNKWLRPLFDGCQSSTPGEMTMWCFFNLGIKTQSVPGGGGYVRAANGPMTHPSLCPCFRRNTAQAGRNWYGRFYGPSIPSSFLTNGVYNGLAKTIYPALATAYITPWTSQGVTFTPAHYTPMVGGISPLTRVDWLPLPSVIRKRRFTELPYHQTPISWPVVN